MGEKWKNGRKIGQQIVNAGRNWEKNKKNNEIMRGCFVGGVKLIQ